MTTTKRTLRILYVEDDIADQVIVDKTLQSSEDDFQLDICCNIAEAKRYLAQHHKTIDVILLDLFLPDCSDLEGLKALLRQQPQKPIVVLTSQDDPAMGRSAIAAGAQDYIAKSQIAAESFLSRTIFYAYERVQRQFLEAAQTKLPENLQQRKVDPNSSDPSKSTIRNKVSLLKTLVEEFSKLLAQKKFQSSAVPSSPADDIVRIALSENISAEDLLYIHSLAVERLIAEHPEKAGGIRERARLLTLSLITRLNAARQTPEDYF